MSLFATKFGAVNPPIYRELHFRSVARRVCDRRILYARGDNVWEPRPWGTRIVLVSVPYISLIDRRRAQ